jgi:parallel beta-helix repeat protein
MQNQIVFYISTDGNDGWSGKLAQPDASRSDGPFASLEGARHAVRDLKSQGDLAGAVKVLLRGGKYTLKETFVLEAQDSGAPTTPITYQAYPGERAIISGGRRVSGWSHFQEGIWRSDLPGSKGGKWQFRQLFYQGKRMEAARWPKRDPQNPLYGGWAFVDEPARPGSSTAFRFQAGVFPHAWSKPSELEVVSFMGPGCWPNRVPVKDVDQAQRTITLAHAGLQFDVPGWYQTNTWAHDYRFYVRNGLEDLTMPGEWCFDAEEGQLYFWFPGDTQDSAEVVVPTLDRLVDLRGTSWISLVNLTFTETLDGDNFHPEGVEGSGAMYPHPGWRYCGEAVYLKDAEHCCIEGCLFDAVGGNGIYLESYNARHTISHNEFDQAGANAICLLGTRLKHPMFNTVSDNHIHDCGVINIIHHNLLEHLPHHAINLSNSPYGRNVVEYNHIRYADQEVNDSGAINCWMEEPPDKNIQRCGHIIRFNLITDTYACAVTEGQVLPGKNTFSSGIYLDNYTSNCFVYGNIVVRAASGGIIIHAGKNNFIENNILVDCLYGIRPQDYISGWEFWKPMAGFMTGNHFIHNIISSRQPGAQLLNLYNWTERTLAQCDENLYYMEDGIYRIQDDTIPDPQQRSIPFEGWQRMGYDQHSQQADPGFLDAGKDDYRLREDSPALRLGIVSIDIAKIGPRKRD